MVTFEISVILIWVYVLELMVLPLDLYNFSVSFVIKTCAFYLKKRRYS